MVDVTRHENGRTDIKAMFPSSAIAWATMGVILFSTVYFFRKQLLLTTSSPASIPATAGSLIAKGAKAKTSDDTNSVDFEEDEDDQEKETDETSKQQKQQQGEAVDVWAERIKKGVAPASLNHKGGAGTEKPFSSSYYYAHNNPKTKGGYTDGLRMEDFTMNQPRLLSKGSNVSSRATSFSENDVMPKQEPSNSVNGGDNDASSTPPQTQTPPNRNSRRVLAITKYLWDDPGTGVATIRIDQFPGKLSTDPLISWKDVPVSNVESELRDQSKTQSSSSSNSSNDRGLLVTVRTEEGAHDYDYRLHISRLYGPVDKVTTTIKAKKRLLVALHKTTGILDKSNAKAWPHPQKKTK